LLHAFATKAWHFQALLLLSVSVPAEQASLAVMLNDEASACGVGQGELQGMLFGMRTMTEIIAPFAWSSIYALGLRHGWPGAFFIGAAALKVGSHCATSEGGTMRSGG
jgi:hypothetical protein